MSSHNPYSSCPPGQGHGSLPNMPSMGPRGYSAYELARENGYQGNVTQWLASLQGPPGVGLPGADGQSAYQIAVDQGFVGTEAEWLASLVGEPGRDGIDGQEGAAGRDGIDGINGADGTDGVDGVDGESAYQIAVSQGFIGTQAEWLQSLKGAPGDKGDKGDKGDEGEPGLNGSDGSNGVDGKSVELRTTAEDIQWRQEGDPWNQLISLSQLKGDTGQGLKNRGNWVVGTYEPGDFVFSLGTNGATSMWVLFSETTYQSTLSPIEDQAHWTELQAATGAKGDKGDKGDAGEKGDKGDPGVNGIDGENGSDGQAASVAVGVVTTGLPDSEAEVTNTGTPTNAVLAFTIPRGSDGPKGDKGDQGEQGIQGIQGVQGEQGIPGIKGDKGDKGDPAQDLEILGGSGVQVTKVANNVTLEGVGADTVEITGASATLGLVHANRFVRCNNATAQTITIPTQATVAWPDNIQLEGAQWGAGAVTFVGASGVTIRKSSKITATTDGQYSPWGLKRTGLNEWLLFGQMGSA